MRRVFLDTETTGMSWRSGDRLIEIGAVEFDDRKKTGRVFHVYLQPDCAIDDAAWHVHGMTTEFLADKPLFREVAQDLVAFLSGAEVLIHNATFDLGFLDSELKECGLPGVEQSAQRVVDTLKLAKDMNVNARASLDALVQKFKIKAPARNEHGALKDAQLLSEVWLAMTRGQTDLGVHAQEGRLGQAARAPTTSSLKAQMAVRQTLAFVAPPSDTAAHDAIMRKISCAK